MRILLCLIIVCLFSAIAQADSARVDFPDQQQQEQLNEKYDRMLPFHAQQAIDLGYHLPLPFSLSLIPSVAKQGYDIHSLEVSYGDNNLSDKYDLSQVTWGDPEIESATLQLRAAAWVLPNLQVGVHGGRFRGQTALSVAIPTSIFERFSEHCQADPRLGGELCAKIGEVIEIPTFEIDDIKGTNWGFSANFVGQFGGFTYVMPLSMTQSKTDDGRTTAKTVMFSPRIGQLFPIEGYGAIYGYVGAAYMNTEGRVAEDDALGVEGLSYSLEQSSSSQYAAVVGMNWNFADSFGTSLELVAGPERNLVNMVMTYSY
ncbi:hypothetical protein BCU00_001005 [Vibrio breoganii]|uniref:hypothetical protein n=1 Tax=Vibrio breoganii TaxID=553239 RepID=UPI000C81A89A|nr:hypothetical protein [Vibrio breoganii]PMK47643.1 hypothetical protein BCU00_04700 [Vibrio breoganii]